ncbi:MAG: hypothetical protein GWO20_13275 [Candidatus Korarchaeota archaeon]|nr:hypothetical protein [Candidatus Korarchaeota archaeon]NIU84366.1 hypothetical protein [Candidatus Thorarchaeota archaeon]NIW14482.1 hypothetical protein [Candidatus Thorarchaeota archaeon]NIW52559.1 hypothetical protein [Candidatus Korarchaeota archaeon]
MNSDRKVIAGILLLTLLILSGLATPLLNNETKQTENQETRKNSTRQKNGDSRMKTHENQAKIRQIDNQLLNSPPKPKTSSPEHLHTQGERWIKSPGQWWDTSWEYRQNVSITEPNGEGRSDWPIHVVLNFTPPAYYYSIRVIDPDNNELPYQPWNLTYVNSSYLDAATISFMVDTAPPDSKTYQVYWSTSDKPLPSYTNTLTIGTSSTPEGTKYTISSELGWSLTLPPLRGGTAKNFTHQSGTRLGHSDWLHFGISRNPSTEYGGYWGTGNTDNTRYEWRGLEENQDPLENQFKGTIFVTYKVSNLPLYDSTEDDDFAKVNLTYRFYRWGWTTEEKIKWEKSETNTQYWMNGWVFDQDGINSPFSPRFDYVSTNAGVTYLPPSGLIPIFSDNFEDGSLDANWTLTGTGGVGDHTSNSGSYSAYHAANPGSVTSKTIDLSGAQYANVSYWIRRGDDSFSENPDAGEDFVVEYKDSTGSWQQLDFFLGDGTPGEIFEREHSLTSDALHANFQVRFRQTDGSGSYYGIYDFWHFDDPTIKIYNGSDVSGSARNYTAFVNGEGVGKVWLRNASLNVDVVNDEWIWYSERNNTLQEEDYLLGGKNVTLNVSSASWLTSKYAMIPWTPTGANPYTRLDGFNTTRASLWNPVNISKSDIERFKLKLKVRVQDKDATGIEGGEVRVKDAHIAKETNSYNYSQVTNTIGNATFDVRRVWFNITVNITSAGHTYFKNKSQDFSQFNYTTHSVPILIEYPFLVHLLVHCQSSPGGENIQGGVLSLENGTDGGGWVLNSSTNLTGWVDMMMPANNYTGKSYPKWNLTFNAKPGDHEWDSFGIYHLENESLVENETTYFNFTINTGTGYLLKDLLVGEVPESEMVWSDTPNANPFWGENISGAMILRDEETKARLNGTIEWWVFDPSENVMLSEQGNTNSQGEYSFAFNISKLPAGTTYTMQIESTPDDPNYNLPPPLERTITVDRVPTSVSLSVEWGASGSYWDESLELVVSYTNELKGNGILHSSVEGLLTKGGFQHKFKNQTWTTIGPGTFRLAFPHFRQDGPGSYSVRVNASRRNFTSSEEVKTLAVFKRPTSLHTRSYIQIPWSYNFTFHANYTDELYQAPVTDKTYSRMDLLNVTYNASLTYTLTDQSGSTLEVGNLNYWSKNELYNQTIQIDGNLPSVGTYTLTIYAGKRAFENQTLRSTLDIIERATELTAEPARVEKTYGEWMKVRFDYEDLDYSDYPFGEDPHLSNASLKRYTISAAETFSPLRGNLTDLQNGSYELSMSTKTINMTGTFSLYVNLKKAHYEQRTERVTLIVEEIPTIASATKKEATAYWGNNISIDIDWIHAENDTFIPNARNHSWYFNSNLHGNLTAPNGSTTQLNGTYRFELNTSFLGIGTHHIAIYLEKPLREEQTLTITITVEDIPTVASVSRGDISTYWGVVESVNGSYYRSQEYRGILAPILDAEAVYYTIPKAGLAGNLTEIGGGVYNLTIDTHSLNISTYGIHLYFRETNHTSQMIFISLTINAIPAIVSYPTKKSVIWGDPLTIEITVINTLTREKISELQKTATMANQSYTSFFHTIGNGTFLFNTSTSDLKEGRTYVLNITLTKENYDIPNVFVEVHVRSFTNTIEIKYEEIQKNIKQNPITSGVSKADKKVTISIYDSVHGRTLTGVTIRYRVEGIGTGTFTEGSIPGTYTAYIDWSKAKAGRHYVVTLKVIRLTIAGEEVLLSDYGLSVTGPSQGVDVDYWGGSIQIAGIRLPNLWFFTFLGVGMILVILGSIRLYVYVSTPPQVRELDKLIEQIEEEGTLEYPMITRTEQFEEYLEKHP